jgi:ABC-type polysaccharide/polyol phosphate export permease
MAIRYLAAVGNEVHKGLLQAWSERLQILIELPMFAVFILLLGPLLGQGQHIATGHVHWSLSSGTTSVLVVWFVPFIFLYMQVVKMFWRLLGEIQSGTIEQVYLSPLPSWLVAAAGRVVAALVETLLVAGATYGIVRAFVPLHIAWTPAALLPALLIVLSAVGVSLIVAGATLVWKRIQMVNDTVLMLVMLFSAAAVPLISVPGWWAGTGRVFPLTAGVASLYNVLLGHRPVATAWGMGGLVWLLVTAAAYLAVGILAFRLGEYTAKRRGTLARY